MWCFQRTAPSYDLFQRSLQGQPAAHALLSENGGFWAGCSLGSCKPHPGWGGLVRRGWGGAEISWCMSHPAHSAGCSTESHQLLCATPLTGISLWRQMCSNPRRQRTFLWIFLPFSFFVCFTLWVWSTFDRIWLDGTQTCYTGQAFEEMRAFLMCLVVSDSLREWQFPLMSWTPNI